MAYTLLYAGFDGLDVAFQGRSSDPVLTVLAEARTEAEAISGPVAREINGLRFTVAPHGAGRRDNRYRFCLDTGDDGELWFVRDSSDPRRWNLDTSVRAFALLKHRYGGVRLRLQHHLDALEATLAATSVHRVDLACDFDAPGFEPEPDCFVSPARTHARSYHPGAGARAAEVTVNRLARRVNGVTVGRMPGRQLCLYDKRADSLAKRKLFWGQVWGLEPTGHHYPVWRLEARAGRNELARHLRQRSFEAVEAGLAEIVASMLSKVRYVVPSATDTNPARWPIHPFWTATKHQLLAAIGAHAFGPAPPRPDLVMPRDIKRLVIDRQLAGLARTVGALHGLKPDQADELPNLVAMLVREDLRRRPGETARGLERARARHGILDGLQCPFSIGRLRPLNLARGAPGGGRRTGS